MVLGIGIGIGLGLGLGLRIGLRIGLRFYIHFQERNITAFIGLFSLSMTFLSYFIMFIVLFL